MLIRLVAVVASAASVLSSLVACSSGTSTQATCNSDGALTYAAFGQPFFKSYCLRCHSASVTGAARKGSPADHNFDTVDEIRGLSEHIDQYAGGGPAGVNVKMPTDGPKPTEEERRKLSQWLACGAP